MQTGTKFITFFRSLLLFFLLSSSRSYQPNHNTIPTLTQICKSPRNQIISQQSITNANQYHNIVKNSFSENGTNVINTTLQTMNYNTITTNSPKLLQQYIIFIGPFVLGLLILLLAFPFLFLCCICPSICPFPKCCRTKMGKPYQKCQLIWPALLLMLALGTVLAASIVGLVKIDKMGKSVEGFGCAVSMLFDDIINGNMASNGQYFVGLQPLSRQLDIFVDLIPNITATLNFILVSYDKYYINDIQNIKTSIPNIPNNITQQSITPISYGSPFNAEQNLAYIPSKLPRQLGSTKNTSSLLYQSYNELVSNFSSIGKFQQDINQTTIKLDAISQISSNNVFSLTPIKTAVLNSIPPLQDLNNQFYDFYSIIPPYLSIGIKALTGLYGGLVGLSSLALIATFLMVIKKMYSCRYLVYGVCFLFVFVGIITFLIVSAVSLLVPVVYFTCDYTTTALSSATNFNNIFGSLLDPSLSSMISQCLQRQGNLLKTELFSNSGSDQISTLQQLGNVMKSIGQFDSVEINGRIDGAWMPVFNLVDDYNMYKVFDFDSPDDQKILEKISQPTNYNCTQLVTNGDSWIPSNISPINCKSTHNYTPTVNDCSVLGTPPNNFSTNSNNCKGCLTAAIFYNDENFTNQLINRYQNCTSFTNQLSAIYSNYYVIKQKNYSPIFNRTVQSHTQIQAYKTNITKFSTYLASIIQNLSYNVSSLINPKYGMVVGLSYSIIGQDLILINNSICVNGFQFLFLMRLIFGICSFGILMVLFCSTCTGIRYYKHQFALYQIQIQHQHQRKIRKMKHQQTTQNILDQKQRKIKQLRYSPKRFASQTKQITNNKYFNPDN